MKSAENLNKPIIKICISNCVFIHNVNELGLGYYDYIPPK